MIKLKLFLALLLFIQISCKNETEKNKIVADKKTELQKNRPLVAESQKFNFENFKILKGRVGKIKVGMNIKDAEKFLNQLTQKEAEAYDFGFDGGGKAYIYSLKNDPILALIPKRDSDEIIAIAAISKNLKTSNGLTPKSTVAEILEKDPYIKVNLNAMMEWEFILDKKNDLQFIFMTNEDNQIGEYEEMETPVGPKKTNIKADWIEVR